MCETEIKPYELLSAATVHVHMDTATASPEQKVKRERESGKKIKKNKIK